MVFCSNCGSKIDDEYYFCPKCGAKTLRGKTANAVYPADELRDAFYQAGLELEKALRIAAKETHNALKKVSEDLQKKTASTASSENMMACPKCGTKNITGSSFCSNCGNQLASSK